VVGRAASLDYTFVAALRTTIVMGLGNPGPAYAGTRHNVGFRCVDSFAHRHGATFSRTRARSRVAELELNGRRVVLAKPRTFMNLSGLAADSLLRSFRVSAEDLIVVYDDIALPLGTMRVRPSGSHGGHNGMKSIIAALDTDRFTRVRIGIANIELDEGETVSDSLVDFVLSRFTDEENRVVGRVLATATDALMCILQDGVDVAMNRFN